MDQSVDKTLSMSNPQIDALKNFASMQSDSLTDQQQIQVQQAQQIHQQVQQEANKDLNMPSEMQGKKNKCKKKKIKKIKIKNNK